MRRTTLSVAVLVGATLLLLVGYSHSRQPENVRPFMRAKLEHSQKVLEGLTTEDFDMIAKGAAQMEILSQEAAWQVLQTPEYRQQSLEFRRAAKSLKDAADDESIDKAALAYVDLTMKCVKCHEYVRNVRNAGTADEL